MVAAAGGPSSLPLDRLLGTVIQSKTSTFWNSREAEPLPRFVVMSSTEITQGAVTQNRPPG